METVALLRLVTLGGATPTGLALLCAASPKVAKANTVKLLKTGYFGLWNTISIGSISVVSPKVAKASTVKPSLLLYCEFLLKNWLPWVMQPN